jgi:hypothetical protein
MTNEPKKPAAERPQAPKAAPPPPPPAGKGPETGNLPVQGFVEAYERYAGSVQGVWSEAEKRSQEAAQKLLQEQEQQHEQAQQGWVREQQEAWTEAQRRYEEAYRQYVRRLRDAWSQGDPDKLDVVSLLTIGQSLQAAAVLAQSTMGAWNMTGGWATQNEPPR